MRQFNLVVAKSKTRNLDRIAMGHAAQELRDHKQIFTVLMNGPIFSKEAADSSERQ
jgi:hypothetical protein